MIVSLIIVFFVIGGIAVIIGDSYLRAKLIKTRNEYHFMEIHDMQ